MLFFIYDDTTEKEVIFDSLLYKIFDAQMKRKTLI